jgi:hypothetical protein
MLKTSEAGSIVCAINVGNVRTKLKPQRMFDSYNFGAGLDYGNTTGSKPQKRAQLSRQKPSAPPRLIYDVQAASTALTLAPRSTATKKF